MKTRMVEERIGEWLGPVDWAYDFSQHKTITTYFIDKGVAALRRIEEVSGRDDPALEGWRYWPSGFNAFDVVCVGMYDGWPFWKPTPAIGYIGPLRSVEVAFFYNLDLQHNLYYLGTRHRGHR